MTGRVGDSRLFSPPAGGVDRRSRAQEDTRQSALFSYSCLVPISVGKTPERSHHPGGLLLATLRLSKLRRSATRRQPDWASYLGRLYSLFLKGRCEKEATGTGEEGGG